MKALYFFINHKFILTTICICLYSCSKDPLVIESYNDYPKEIGDITLAQCATQGCHNEASKGGAAGLSLASWEKLFEGSNGGSTVIPYRPDQSFLFFSINTFPDLGVSLHPTMPINQKSLSKEQVLKIKNWILNGAPNDKGFVKFSDNPDRKKFYVFNSKCKLVTVFDKETKLIMRYIDAGSSLDGVPCMIKVAPDNNNWYVLFTGENSISSLKKYKASDDQLESKLILNNSSWKTIKISSDSKKALIADTKGNNTFLGGSISYIDLVNMKLLHTYEAPLDSLFFPIGIEANNNFSIAYSACFHSNYLHKINLITNTITKVRLNPNDAPIIDDVDDTYNPVQILLSPDESEYFVLCSRSHEIRIFKTSNDSLLKIIPIGINPLEMKLSKNKNYLFVSDTSRFNSHKGAVFVIDYKSHSLINTIYTGNQPQGMAVDDEKGVVYVANRNIGGSSHHVTACVGKPGYITIINMNSFELIKNYSTEVSVDPISISIRQ